MQERPHEPSDFATRLTEGIRLQELGQLDSAEVIYLGLLSEDPLNFHATHCLGVISTQRGDYQKGAEILERALRIFPRSPLGHLNLGIALSNLDQPEEALAHYQYSLALKPGNPDALWRQTAALRDLGRYEEALASADKYLLLLPESPEGHQNRAGILHLLQRPDEALGSIQTAQALREALELPGRLANGPDSPHAMEAPFFHSSDEAVVQIAALTDSGQLESALVGAERALGRFPEDWRLYQQKARALESLATAVGDPLASAECCLQAAANYLRAAALLGDHEPHRSLLRPALICQGRGLQDKADAYAALELSHCLLGKVDAPRPRPLGLFLSTLPKSASAYIWMALATGLNLRPERISNNVLGETEMVDLERLEKLSCRGGFVAHGHFEPTDYNLAALNQHVGKLVVHVRDPRQTILSWAHYLPSIAKGKVASNHQWAPWIERPLAERIDRTIEWFLPRQLEYLRSWAEAIDSGRISIPTLITRQDELLANPALYFSTILDFYEVDPSVFSAPPAPQKGELHFRAADSTEWRRELPTAQVTKIQDLVPDSVLERFNWPR